MEIFLYNCFQVQYTLQIIKSNRIKQVDYKINYMYTIHFMFNNFSKITTIIFKDFRCNYN